MAITAITQVTSGGTTSNATTYTTGAQSYVAGRTYVLAVHGTKASAAAAPTSCAGTGVTFVAKANQGFGTSTLSNLSLWYFQATSSASVDVTITFATANTGCAWTLYEVQGAETVGDPFAQAVVFTSGPPTAASTTASATLGSSVTAGNAVFSTVAYAVNSTTDSSPDSGWTAGTGAAYNTPTTGIRSAYQIAQDTSVVWTGSSALRSACIAELRAGKTATVSATLPKASVAATGKLAIQATLAKTLPKVAMASSATLSQAPVSSVTIAPSTLSIGVGQMGNLVLTLRDASNNPLAGRTVSIQNGSPSIAFLAVGHLGRMSGSLPKVTGAATATLGGGGGGLSLGLSQSTATLTAGDYVYLTATPSGGTAPYTVAWTHSDGTDRRVISAPNPGYSSTTGTISPIIPTTGTPVTITATVTDSLGATAQATCAVTVNAPSVVDPTLPTSEVDFTYPTQTGTVWGPYTTWTNIQNAINNAALGDTILIGQNAGADINLASRLELKNKTTGTGWIVIKGDVDLSGDPMTTRMTPSRSATIGLPKLRTQGTNEPVFAVTPGVPVHHYRLVGLDLGINTATTDVSTLVQFGWTAAADGAHATAANQPHHLIIDRCVLRGIDYATSGGATRNCRHGVGAHGANIGMIASYADEFHDINSDSQAWFMLNGSGPYTVINSYLGASDECMMSGGGDARADELNPADITFRYCHFKKRPEWRTQGRRVKNIWELKNARRVLMEYCILENNWVGAQNGDGILIQNISNDNTRDSLSIQDVTIRYNIIKNVLQGFTLSGRVFEGPNGLVTRETTQRIKIVHNLFENLTDLTGSGLPVRNYQGGSGQLATQIAHNTFAVLSGGAVNSTMVGQAIDSYHLRLNDNIMSLGTYGWFGDGGTQGTAALNAWWPGYWQATGNLLYDAGGGSWGGSSAYPAGNNFPTGNVTTIGFTNPVAGGNWSLASGSTYKNTASDGTDPGVDWSTLSTNTSGVEAGTP